MGCRQSAAAWFPPDVDVESAVLLPISRTKSLKIDIVTGADAPGQELHAT
jgi:hypothetical protein